MDKKNHASPVGLPTLLCETITHFIEKGITADRALNETFRKYKIRDEEQRSELALRFYGVIRFWRPLVTALGEDKFDRVDATKRLIGAFNAWKKLYNGEPQENLQGQVADRLNKYLKVRKLRESFPDWLDEFAVKQLGEEKWESLSKALNKDPKLYLRVNTLKISRDELLGKMKKLGLEVFAVNDLPDAIYMKVYSNVFNLEFFHEGFFEVQDLSSQRVSIFADVRPGMRVLDACAGNGGKTLHLGALMKNRGKIVAMDVAQNKLDELRARCSRNGIDLVETKKVDVAVDLNSLKETFDRVLLDVPCTGTGVLRRNPDIRWRLYPEDVQKMMIEQKEILNRYSNFVKKDGEMIYATCSIFPCEGEDQVQKFLDENSEKWKLMEEKRINPVLEDGDGFYFAKLKKIS